MSMATDFLADWLSKNACSGLPPCSGRSPVAMLTERCILEAEDEGFLEDELQCAARRTFGLDLFGAILLNIVSVRVAGGATALLPQMLPDRGGPRPETSP
jgi:hypothetical protein